MTPYDDAADFDAIGAAVDTGELPQRVMVTGSPDVEVSNLPPSLQIGPAKLLLPDHDLPSLDEVTRACVRRAAPTEPSRSIASRACSFVLTLAAFEEVGTVRGDRIEHGAVIPRELDHTLRTMRLAVVTQPNFASERGDEYLTSVDAADLDDLWRCASLMDAGVTVGAGSDAPFGRPDPWALIQSAVDRRTRRVRC